MKKAISSAILRVAKAAGLFSLARLVTARDLRIVCYHGAALCDEHLFRPTLFIDEATFAQRMQFLTDEGYPVIELGEALRLMRRGALPRFATVITIDDGWYGTYRLMAPILRRHGFPATLYVATHYLETQTQVFDVALAYVLWRSKDRVIDLADVADGLHGSFALSDPEQCGRAFNLVNNVADVMGNAHDRQALLRRICKVLKVSNWPEIERDRTIAYMTEGEARELLGMGFDLQLHTHRHTFPRKSFATAKAEIDDNRRSLSRITKRALQHLCYPSGEYEQSQIEWLHHFDVVSATTCKPGFVRPSTSRFELGRFLDSNSLSPIEFEAEISGFREMVRRCAERASIVVQRKKKAARPGDLGEPAWTAQPNVATSSSIPVSPMTGSEGSANADDAKRQNRELTSTDVN